MAKIGSLSASKKRMSNREYMSILRQISTYKSSAAARIHKMAKIKHAPREMNKYVVMVQCYLDI